jgi:hypothetical protein
MASIKNPERGIAYRSEGNQILLFCWRARSILYKTGINPRGFVAKTPEIFY